MAWWSRSYSWAVCFASVRLSHRGVVTVQTGKVTKQDLTSIVTASGEIKPKNYIDIGANAMGELTQDLCQRRRPRPERTATRER